MTMRLPLTSKPDLISACKAPAPMTLGNVHPGKGRNCSRAPVARINLSKEMWCVASFDSAKSSSPVAWKTRVERSHLMGACSRRLNHCAALTCFDEPFSPRQICPPGLGLSSISTTDAPHSAATVAAAMPAGPAPTTATSQRRSNSLFIGADFHAGFASELAAFEMRPSVDRDAAFEADAHAAERCAWLASS